MPLQLPFEFRSDRAERSKIEPRPLQPKIDLFNHGVGRRHDESIAAPDRGIIGWCGN